MAAFLVNYRETYFLKRPHHVLRTNFATCHQLCWDFGSCNKIHPYLLRDWFVFFSKRIQVKSYELFRVIPGIFHGISVCDNT